MDFFLELNKNPAARRIVRGLGLPLPQPPFLRRARLPWRQRILDDARFVVYGDERSELLAPLADTLAKAGSRVLFSGPEASAEPFREPSRAWAEPLSLRAEPKEGERIDGLVLDATGLDGWERLATLYDTTHPWVRNLRDSGRIVVLGRPESDASSVEHAVAQRALDGFTRSLAKEVGYKGVTANLVYVARGAEDRLSGPLRFFASPHSAFITAQTTLVGCQVSPNRASAHQLPLFGKRFAVTGAARGIGAATARALAREGAHVVIVDRPDMDDEASSLAAEIGGSLLLVDLGAADAVDVFERELQQGGSLSGIVHNAGVTRDKTLARMTREQWDLVLDVNLGAVQTITRRLLDAGLLQDEGRLVFLSSVTGLAGNRGQTNYAASKAGLIGYARALAPLLAPRGITVNAIAPGLIETKMTQRMPTIVREAARRLSALSQGGLPQDVAEAIVYLCLPSSDGVTGSVLRVCGGALVGA